MSFAIPAGLLTSGFANNRVRLDEVRAKRHTKGFSGHGNSERTAALDFPNGSAAFRAGVRGVLERINGHALRDSRARSSDARRGGQKGWRSAAGTARSRR